MSCCSAITTPGHMPMSELEELKRRSAQRAAAYVRDHMVLGLGTGSTVRWLIEELGRHTDKQHLQVVSSSLASKLLAQQAGLCVVEPDVIDHIDLVIDGVDQIDSRKQAIKGGGGALVREVLAREPRRVVGMALIAPVVDPQHVGRHVAEHVVANPNPKLTHSLPQEQVFDFITMGVNQSFDAWRRYQRFILPGVALCDRAACERLDQRYWLDDDPEETLGTYAGPVLIVTGKQDQIVGYEDQQALLPHYPNATFVTLDNAGHNAHIDQPEAVVALVREWVARLHV